MTLKHNALTRLLHHEFFADLDKRLIKPQTTPEEEKYAAALLIEFGRCRLRGLSEEAANYVPYPRTVVAAGEALLQRAQHLRAYCATITASWSDRTRPVRGQRLELARHVVDGRVDLWGAMIVATETLVTKSIPIEARKLRKVLDTLLIVLDDLDTQITEPAVFRSIAALVDSGKIQPIRRRICSRFRDPGMVWFLGVSLDVLCEAEQRESDERLTEMASNLVAIARRRKQPRLATSMALLDVVETFRETYERKSA